MIEARKVNFQYEGSFSLKNINLKVEKGKILGIIGQSGSGKTTLLKLLAGLKEPTSGSILLDNQPLDPPSKKLIAGHKQIKMVTQQNTLFPNISIAENIAYELRYFEKKYQNQRISKLAKDLNINHLLSKFPRELSGGEIQRAMLAKAIADEPLLLLLDEPFANLDPIIKKKVMTNLQSVLRKEAVACVFVTHDIHDAFGLVDELFIIKNGRMVQKGSSEKIYHEPKNKYVALLTGDGFVLNLDTKELFVRAENIEISPEGTFEAEIINNIFKGSYYETIIDFQHTTIYCQSKKMYEVGSKVKINLHSIVYFDKD
ncbi:MAG TPA: ABC transporter ATP-binding protein [Leadbetterella sp.]|nr:ABC transporter ATP-binding protein [Leadbetterella sp.]